VLIGAIKDLRVHWFKPLSRNKTISEEERNIAEATSQLLKLILVSSYGVTIRIHGLSRPSLAETITAYGRYFLQKTWDLAKNIGLVPIYGDTDSLFLEDPEKKLVSSLISSVKERFNLNLAVEEEYSVCVLPRAMKAYFGVRSDGTYDIKGVAAIKSNSPPVFRKVFTSCVREIGKMTSKSAFEETNHRIKEIIQKAREEIKTGKVSLNDLKYDVELHEDPKKKINEKTLHQPYQCAKQLMDEGKTLRKGDVVTFIKVKPFRYKDKTFTVKPIQNVKKNQEINYQDYIRNLEKTLNQTLKFFNINVEKNEKIKLSDFM
jgi:DNA polymerase I